MTQLDRRAAELSRFFPQRAVAAILGVDRDEIADLRSATVDPIDPATGFRDPRFSTTIYGGENEITFDDPTGAGAGFVDFFFLNMDSFIDVLGASDEYLLEVWAYGEWKTTDEGSDPDAPIGLMLQLGYDGVALQGPEVDTGTGEHYPLGGDSHVSSLVNFPTLDPDDFYAWDLEGSREQWETVAVRGPAPRAYAATRTWVVDKIATVSVQVGLFDNLSVSASERGEGAAVLRNTQIGARLLTQSSLAEG